MPQATGTPPPLSPVLLAGLLARPLPPAALQPLLAGAAATARRVRPDVIRRLASLPDADVRIMPVDLPFAFVLRTGSREPVLSVHRPDDETPATATIRGSLAMLIELAGGRLDGDAAFFSRDLAIEGDTEIVVALRNALDGAGIDPLEDLARLLGPMAGPFRHAAGAASTLAGRLSSDLAMVQRAALAPLARRVERNAARIGRLEETVADLTRRQARKKARTS